MHGLTEYKWRHGSPITYRIRNCAGSVLRMRRDDKMVTSRMPHGKFYKRRYNKRRRSAFN